MTRLLLMATPLLLLASSPVAIRTYYRLKPAIPRYVRHTLRQRLAVRQREHFAATWPILERAAKKPEGWRGWPDDRKFAFVLSHDVESQVGLERVKALAELEMSLGFRSSMNFIPEGPYVPPPELLRWLTERGFEVGVHDHRHDGKLYHSYEQFRASAQRINHFLSEWNAVGFRSAYMLRNLDWIHDLDVLYDASTFDTDPFEPQPDGVETIFPYWVRGAGRKGYVELPYTLAQDSTLFLLLKERTNRIWKQKLEWLAASGGMALMNVHPDYMCFGAPGNRYECSVELYRDFLQHVRSAYRGAYWAALPRRVAGFYRQSLIHSNSISGSLQASAVNHLCRPNHFPPGTHEGSQNSRTAPVEPQILPGRPVRWPGWRGQV